MCDINSYERIKGFSTVIENKRWPTSFSLYLIYTSLQILHSVVVDRNRDQETEIKQKQSNQDQCVEGFNMANVRDSDTSLWLHNKLGTSNDSWTGGSICSQLNAEVLRNIKDCFPDLQTQVKLKLLLSFFHIPRRNVEEVCHINTIFL